MKRAIEEIDAEADRAWERRVRDDEFRHLPRRDLAEINFPVRFERATRTQDRHPLNGINVAADLFAAGQQDVIFEIQNPGRAVRALEQFPDPDEVPAFAVGHRRVSRSLEKMRARNDALEKFVGARADQFLGRVALHKQIEAVDLLPHLARDLFARRSRIFSRARQTRHDRIRIFLLQADEIDDGPTVRLRIERGEKIVLFKRADDGVPLLVRIGFLLVRQVEQHLEIHFRDARVVLRALDVAAHPIK